MSRPERDDTGRDDIDLDPFERRLATRLDRQAAGVDVDPDGLSAIRARVAHRRRRRRLAAGLASVAVLVVVAAGVLDLTRSSDDTDVVDAGGATMPFLGFANDTWQVLSYAPGTSYAAVDSMEGSSDEAVTLLVTRNGTGPGETNQAGPSGGLGVERIAERTIEHSEGPVQVGTIRWASGEEGRPPTEGPALWWSPLPGWTATLMGNSPAAFDDVDVLLDAADPVVDVDRTTWERRLPSPVGPGELDESPTLILPDDVGTTDLVSVTDEGLRLWLDPIVADRPDVTMLVAPARTMWTRGMWEPTQVRGVEGRAGLGDSGELGAEPRRGVSLTWTEAGRDHSLLAPFGTPIEALVDLAATLVEPNDATWEELVVPPAATARLVMPPGAAWEELVVPPTSRATSSPGTVGGEEPSAGFGPG